MYLNNDIYAEFNDQHKKISDNTTNTPNDKEAKIAYSNMVKELISFFDSYINTKDFSSTENINNINIESIRNNIKV